MDCKKIACVTFHAAHNYGSNLQAYALQEYVSTLTNCEYRIINLRTKIQKDIYNVCFERKNIKGFIKSLIFMKYKKMLYKKYAKYEEFICNNLNLYGNYEQIDDSFDSSKFDYYISGSDQLWNLAPIDFNWAYYLDFVKKGKKISYSASFGPKSQSWTEEEKNKVKNYLEKYDFISVREEGSFNNVKELINKEANINVDPTMLLDEVTWKKIINNEPFQKGEYIFLYDLKQSKKTYKLAKKISKILKLPVVICVENPKVIFYDFIKRFDAGPKDFLNLIYNAKLILSTSFHGNVFSIIFNKPFFAINGNNDFRINTLLKKMGLENRSIDINDFKEKTINYCNINFDIANDMLKKEKEKSKEYLKKALDINKEE